MLFSEEDFEGDGHEAEILYRVGPISQQFLESILLQELARREESFERAVMIGVDGSDGSLQSGDGQEGMCFVKAEMKKKCINHKIELACLESYA